MKIFGIFVYGTLAKFFTRLHYAREVRPYAAAKNHSREHVLEASARAHQRVFDLAWPMETGAGDE